MEEDDGGWHRVWRKTMVYGAECGDRRVDARQDCGFSGMIRRHTGVTEQVEIHPVFNVRTLISVRTLNNVQRVR